MVFKNYSSFVAVMNEMFSESYENRIERLTQPQCWDYSRFQDVMVALAHGKRGSVRIPARNRPESIHLQNLRTYIDSLVSSSEREREGGVWENSIGRYRIE